MEDCIVAQIELGEQLGSAERLLTQAEADPEKLEAFVSQPFEAAKEAGFDLFLVMRHLLGLTEVTDDELVDVLHARLRRASSQLSCRNGWRPVPPPA